MSTPDTPHDVRPLAPLVQGVRPTTNGTEQRKERGVALRVLVYVVVAHLLALYLFLMFVVIGHK